MVSEMYSILEKEATCFNIRASASKILGFFVNPNFEMGHKIKVYLKVGQKNIPKYLPMNF